MSRQSVVRKYVEDSIKQNRGSASGIEFKSLDFSGTDLRGLDLSGAWFVD